MMDKDVVEEVCYAIACLCSVHDRNRHALISVSTGEYLITACKRYMESEEMMGHVVPALAAILTYTKRDAVTRKMGELGVCKAIIGRILKTYAGNTTISKKCLFCITALANNSPTFAKELGATEIIGEK